MLLPTLEQFSITTPVFIRKIDNRNHWNPSDCNNSLEERAKRVSDNIFKGTVCSLWKVNLDEQFYGIIASLTAERKPRVQTIDFICITQEDLEEVNIETQPKPQGKCLYVKDLHFDIQLDSSLAQKLCHVLFKKDREPKRCEKNNIREILNYQQSKNCKASDDTLLDCVCQHHKACLS
jgi:hypothetical protein